MADSVVRLTVNSQEYDQKLKRAAEGLQRYVEGCRKVGGTLEFVEKDTLEYVKALGRMETTSRSATGKLSEMRKTFVELSAQYKQLTDQEKQSPFGKEMAKSLDQLKVRINDSRTQLEGINKELIGSKFGQFGSVIDTVGQKFGITGNLTEMLTSKTAMLTGAIGASVAIIGKATDEWAKYNAELAKQDQITTVTTGLKDDSAKEMTDKMRALSDTYKVDFREAINAANTLMSQFGETGENATQLIKDGMQGMIQGDGGKLLSMIQQFAPAFRDAGVSASQLVAVIQNSEGGLFTDQNMQAIVMGIRNIRLMTKSTSEALAKLGIDGQEMSKKMSDGSMTVFDALKLVSRQLQTVDSNSQTAGEVMQTVFGRQGVMAGTNIAKAIEQLNTNLEETKKQTGEVGEAFAELQTANEKLNTAIRDCFEYDGWEQMATGIRSKLVTALAAVVEKLADIRASLSGLPLPSQVKSNQSAGQQELDNRVETLRNSEVPQIQNRVNMAYYNQQVGQRQFKVNSLRGDDAITQGLRKKAEADLQAWKNLRDEYNKKANEILNAPPKSNTINNVKPTPIDNGGNGGNVNKSEVEAVAGSIDAQTKKVQDLQKAWRAAADDKSREDIKKQIEQAQLVLDAMNGKTKTSKITITAETTEALEAVKKIDGVKIDEKSLTITAETTEALAKIQEINGIKIQPKKLEIQVPKIADIAPNGLTGKVRTPEDLQQSAVKMKQAVQLEIDQEASKVDSETLKTLMKDAIQNGIDGMDLQFGILGEKISKGIDIPDVSWQGIIDQYNALREMIGEEPIVINFKTGKIDKVVEETEKLKKTIGTTAQVVGTIGQAFNAIEDPAAKVAGTVAQAIANVALAYSDALAKTVGEKFNIWSFIAAAAASTISMASTIAAIHSQTGYAEGGIIKGNTYSGDMIPANGGSIGLNAGEVVLNRAQSGVLASQLEGSADGFRNGQIVGRIEGEKIVLVANRYFKRTGQGEILTWKN